REREPLEAEREQVHRGMRASGERSAEMGGRFVNAAHVRLARSMRGRLGRHEDADELLFDMRRSEPRLRYALAELVGDEPDELGASRPPRDLERGVAVFVPHRHLRARLDE